MTRQRRRPMYFTVHRLHDGTTLSAYPIRRPSKQELKRDRVRIDPDGVAREFATAGKNLSDVGNETRMRFQDIVATRLNTRQAIRELVPPLLAETMEEVRGLRVQLDRIEALLVLGHTSPGGSGDS
jgi:hypothetical protein